MWRKLGRVFAPAGEHDWMQTHAANPVVVSRGGSVVRIYFACRDREQRAHVGYVEIDMNEPSRVRHVSERPALAPGPLGYFDDHGVYPASIVVGDKGELLLYYIGWNPGPRRPLFYASVGLAVSRDGGRSFERWSAAPILGRSDIDPWMTSAPYVLREGERWRMYYVSGIGWAEEDGQLVSYYHVKYAESDDGVDWRRDGRVALALQEGERNIARACVVPCDGGCEAWYSCNRGDGYSIGYAISRDGVHFERRDAAAGIGRSQSGWDSEALAYPFVFELDGRRYMVYSGNGFGRDGIGLAVEA